IMPRTLVAQIYLQAVVEVGQKIGIDDGGTEQRTAYAVLDDNPDHAKRCATERIGILRTCRFFVDGPEAGQRVELVSQCNGDRDRIGRDDVAWALRTVVLFKRGGDRC